MLLTCGIAKFYVCALIRKRVLGIDLHQSSHGVSTIKCSLRTAQNIYSVDVIEFEIESAYRRKEYHQHKVRQTDY